MRQSLTYLRPIKARPFYECTQIVFILERNHIEHVLAGIDHQVKDHVINEVLY